MERSDASLVGNVPSTASLWSLALSPSFLYSGSEVNRSLGLSVGARARRLQRRLFPNAAFGPLSCSPKGFFCQVSPPSPLQRIVPSPFSRCSSFCSVSTYELNPTLDVASTLSITSPSAFWSAWLRWTWPRQSTSSNSLGDSRALCTP